MLLWKFWMIGALATTPAMPMTTIMMALFVLLSRYSVAAQQQNYRG